MRKPSGDPSDARTYARFCAEAYSYASPQGMYIHKYIQLHIYKKRERERERCIYSVNHLVTYRVWSFSLPVRLGPLFFLSPETELWYVGVRIGRSPVLEIPAS